MMMLYRHHQPTSSHDVWTMDGAASTKNTIHSSQKPNTHDDGRKNLKDSFISFFPVVRVYTKRRRFSRCSTHYYSIIMTGPNQHGDNNGGREPSKNEEAKEEEGAVTKNADNGADGADAVEDVEDPKNNKGGAAASSDPNQEEEVADDENQSKQQQKKKKKRTKVAADAPWSARMWEGTCVATSVLSLR
jgi:hypothetical protein